MIIAIKGADSHRVPLIERTIVRRFCESHITVRSNARISLRAIPTIATIISAMSLLMLLLFQSDVIAKGFFEIAFQRI